MPELPEVETIVRRFRPLLTGRVITGFESRWAKNCTPGAAAVRRGLVGKSIAGLSRRAKFIVFELAGARGGLAGRDAPGGRAGLARRAAAAGRAGLARRAAATRSQKPVAADAAGYLLVHLRMSGRLEWGAEHQQEPPHVRAVWELDGGDRLYLCDARKFGRIIYTPELHLAVAELGLEPLERGFGPAALGRELHRRARQLKPLLLDQSVIAGLGNIYADEALHRAGLHPLVRSDRLSHDQVCALQRAIRAVLREGIRHNGTTFDWVYPSGGMQDRLRVYGRAGEPCRRCGTEIEYLRVGQRGTHVCPRCQPPPRR